MTKYPVHFSAHTTTHISYVMFFLHYSEFLFNCFSSHYWFFLTSVSFIITVLKELKHIKYLEQYQALKSSVSIN